MSMLNRMKLITVLLVACFGCAVGEDLPCEFSYDADPELQSFAEESAVRWATATGCTITVGGGPRRIEAVDYLSDGGDGQATAATFDGGMLIQIHRRSPNISRSVIHEMGHSLGMTGHNGGHGVLSYHKDYVAVIDPESLSDVCENINCSKFEPEADVVTPTDSAVDL